MRLFVSGYASGKWGPDEAAGARSQSDVESADANQEETHQQPDVAAKLTAAGLIIANESPGFFQDYVRGEYAKYGKLVRDIGLKPQ
jgi:tripartite-type tricarboxylate transporter receptor subunit TctC